MFLFLLLSPAGVSYGQDAFVTPEAFPRDRYEAEWAKNPFTLKTAPAPVEKKSFAQDLALLNVYQVMGETSAVLVNTKTQEFIRLKSTGAAANGMRIRSAMIHDIKKDTYVEVELNGESAVLRHDDAARKLVASKSKASKERAEDKGGEKKGETGADGQKTASTGAATPPGPGAGGGRRPGAESATPPAPGTPPRTPSASPTPGRPAPGVTASRATPDRFKRRFNTAPAPESIRPQKRP